MMNAEMWEYAYDTHQFAFETGTIEEAVVDSELEERRSLGWGRDSCVAMLL